MTTLHAARWRQQNISHPEKGYQSNNMLEALASNFTANGLWFCAKNRTFYFLHQRHVHCTVTSNFSGFPSWCYRFNQNVAKRGSWSEKYTNEKGFNFSNHKKFQKTEYAAHNIRWDFTRVMTAFRINRNAHIVEKKKKKTWERWSEAGYGKFSPVRKNLSFLFFPCLNCSELLPYAIFFTAKKRLWQWSMCYSVFIISWKKEINSHFWSSPWIGSKHQKSIIFRNYE